VVAFVSRYRLWLPLAAAVVCFVLASAAAPVVQFVLTMVGVGLVFDAVTQLWSRRGHMHEYHQ
jgi:predicted phage tail protein